MLSITIFLFLSLMPPPSTSTLFPYTTLFRSTPGDGERRLYLARRIIEHRAAAQGLGVLDRKSTRLNSSHTVISYAVFCLKKKKLQPNHAQSDGLTFARTVESTWTRQVS